MKPSSLRRFNKRGPDGKVSLWFANGDAMGRFEEKLRGVGFFQQDRESRSAGSCLPKDTGM
jgi:hypothetical protein